MFKKLAGVVFVVITTIVMVIDYVVHDTITGLSMVLPLIYSICALILVIADMRSVEDDENAD